MPDDGGTTHKGHIGNMHELEPWGSLLEELEARQDEVLAALEQLNQRLEQVLAGWQEGIFGSSLGNG